MDVAVWQVSPTETSPIKFVHDLKNGEIYGILEEVPLEPFQEEVVRSKVFTLRHG